MMALMPHGSCFLYDPQLTSLHVPSDLAVAVAYFSIPLLLLLNRQHIDLQLRPVLLLFAALFLVVALATACACGTSGTTTTGLKAFGLG